MSGPAADVDGPGPDGTWTTERLVLAPPVPADAPALLDAVYGDPRTWALDPSLRRAPEELPAFLARLADRWQRDGAGCWVARRRGGDGAPVGVGGCDRTAPERPWNLFFRLDPAHQGRGYAQEIGRAGLALAHRVRPDLPVTSFAAERNAPSLRTIARLGLGEVWRGPDRRSAEPGAVVVLHADRPLAADLLADLTS